MTKVLMLFNQGENTTLTEVTMSLLNWVKYYATHPFIKLDVVKERLWCDLKYNMALNAAIDFGYDFVFQYDCDMVGAPQTIEWLMEKNKECVGTLFFQRHYPYEPQMWDIVQKDGERHFRQFGKEFIKNAIAEKELLATSVRATGFTLFKTEALKEIGYPFGETTQHPKVKHVVNGWDTSFTKKISDKFGAVYTDCDPKYETKHLSYVCVDERFYIQDRQGALV